MEAFSLLKYWKATAASSGAPPHPSPSTTIVTTVCDHDPEESGGDDDGPFFDLEFPVPADDEGEKQKDEANQQEKEAVIDEQEEDDEVEVEPNLTFSPSSSDDLFFKGRILQIEGSEEQDAIHSGNNNKSSQFPIPVSLARSATKFRVFLLGLKRSKSKQCPPPQNHHHNNKKKLFTVKLKVEEVPIFSFLTRASSSTTDNDGEEQGQKVESEKRNNNKKEVVQRYLKMVKPLYVKVSKKNENEKATAAEKREKMVGQKQQQQQQGLNLNLKVIGKKHLGKSKSAVVHSMVQQNNNTTSSKKRDDSLFQQQDGIQSAILHCKRSFNSSKDFLEGQEASSKLLTQLVNTEEEGNGVVETGVML